MTSAVVRPVAPSDLRPVAEFVARVNSAPAGQSLHCAADSPASMRAALREPATFPGGWERDFALAEVRPGEIAAACGCQLDPDRTQGWIWGPWVDSPAQWATLGRGVLEAVLGSLPPSVRRVEAFLNSENRAGLDFLRSHGFAPGALTHLYVATRGAWKPGHAGEPLPFLRAAHEVGFARLHAETFPARGSTPAGELLASRDDEHAILAIAEGLRLLGYVCVSVNRAPWEGFVEYLAVRPGARGGGIGGRLLQSALRWTFEERGLPQAALCVSDWRGDARRLYERDGFRLHASGIAARLTLPRSSPR